MKKLFDNWLTLFPCMLSVALCLPPALKAQHNQMNHTTEMQMPVTAKSNEATKEQLKDAKAEGDSINRCMEWLIAQLPNSSGQVRAGEYKIVYALSAPEGWYSYSNHQVQWQQPSGEAHLWLFVLDGADGRVVPGLDIKATISVANGTVIDNTTLTYSWIPLINGYANNIKLNGSGNYTLNLQIAPPTYHRHDPYNGDRFTKATEASIPVAIEVNLFQKGLLSTAMEQHQQEAMLPGIAYQHTLKDMYKQANDGRDTVTGDYFVAYAIEYAEGWWAYKGDKFRYMAENDLSGKTNAHVEVAVCDSKTHRFLHDLAVIATLYTSDSNKVNTMAEPFMWHPWLYHYGENWRVPKASHNYTVAIHFEPPAYKRYGRTLGSQFTQPADITFNNVIIKTGQK